MSVPQGALRLLDFIAKYEAPKGYVDYYRGASFPPPRPLTELTVDEVLTWQRDANPPGPGTAAAGKYQIIRKTLSGLKRNLKLSGAEVFTPNMQDEMAFELLRGRGWMDYMEHRISASEFANNVAKEWASMPCVTGPKAGRSYYDGDGVNSALCSSEDFLKAIMDARGNPRVEPDESPVTSPMPVPKPGDDSGDDLLPFGTVLRMLGKHIIRGLNPQGASK